MQVCIVIKLGHHWIWCVWKYKCLFQQNAFEYVEQKVDATPTSLKLDLGQTYRHRGTPLETSEK